ncbi:cobaltochelatase CobT-related protein [Marinobacterium rhizophilum]|uniref:Cobalamin biosynthesis protein CobT n=1 Tax=Marinobacterium rhizophilum TaxID=420402 RepID=A0ABY5HH27_9GAMM|nr:cobalamin biosynthesis protein CobT [Marinobacterium rhizophilum]UTW11141.1 cobalamin biosynthesis protein CobT [Marinobacterium rhizophilum]
MTQSGFNKPLTAWHPEQPPQLASQPAEKSSDAPRLERKQQQVEELSGAAMRAEAGIRNLRFRGRRLEIDGKAYPVRVPHLLTDLERDDFPSFRGAADGIALRLQHNDRRLHERLKPAAPIARLVFEMLEQLRVESLVEDHHPGVRANLKHRFSAWSAQFHATGQTENHIGLMLYTLTQMTWALLSGNPVSEESEMLIEAPRVSLGRQIGAHFGLLRRTRHDQQAFAEHALAIAAVIQDMIDTLNQEMALNEERDASEISENSHQNFSLLLELEGEDGELGGQSVAASGRELAEAAPAYRIFSTQYDRVLQAGKLVRAELLKDLRETLDTRIRAQGLNVPRLARKLARILSAPERDGWEFGLEEGRLDARRLSRLVTTPGYRQLFRQERHQPHSNCLVTFLIDNSGSMKAHIESIAMLVDVFSRALEQAGASTEVLGFTTGHWNGGRPMKQWLGRGKPANPGRLNELNHIVYKDADTPWRRARTSMAALLKPDLFREGVDGEALLWTLSRLQARREERRIVIVISDGCPMDSATLHSNSDDVLDTHLRQVVGQIEARGDMELYALGVGLDLSTYYRHQLQLDLEHRLDNAVFDEVLQLIARGRRR